jgi:hypothetical protein
VSSTPLETEAPAAAPPYHQLSRYSLTQLLILVAFAAVVVGLFVQNRKLANVQAALSRYESSQISTSLAANQFRVIAHTILDTKHVKVVKYRVETTDEHFATLQGTDDSRGRSLSPDPNTGLYFTEMTFVFDHLPTANQIKMSNMGYTLKDVPADYSLDDSVILNDVNGVYDLTDTVDVFVWDNITYSLSLK